MVWWRVDDKPLFNQMIILYNDAFINVRHLPSICEQGAILQTLISSAFSYMKMLKFQINICIPGPYFVKGGKGVNDT